MVSLNATVFGASGNGAVTSTYNFTPVEGVVRTRLAGTYDAGIAKFGLGYQNKTGGTADQYLASVAVPVGNTVFGLDYTARAAQGAFDKGTTGAIATQALTGAREGDKASSSVGIGATYSFSKTTTLNFSYITYNDVGVNEKYATPVVAVAPVLNNDGTLKTAGKTASAFNAGATPVQLDTEYRIRLMKTF
jgi:hypothetical protein